MKKFERVAVAMTIALLALSLQGCLATKVVTVPVKVAYGAGKLAVKGTAAAVRAVVPDKEKDEKVHEQPTDPPPKTTP